MVGKLGFGGATLTNLKSLSEILRILDSAFDNGIRHFDTAPLYGKGYSEVIYGKFLRNKRTQVSVSTKFGLGDNFNTDKLPVHLILALNYIVKSIKRGGSVAPGGQEQYRGPDVRRIDKATVQSSFEKSLRRLNTDFVDYYLLHEAFPSFVTDEAFLYLEELKKRGSIKQLGVGTNALGLRTLDANDLKNWDILQYDGNVPDLVKELMSKFPDHRHFHHSCLKSFHDTAWQRVPVDVRGGFLLAQAATKNNLGKIIFSTRSLSSMKSNIESYNKFSSDPELASSLLSK